MGSIGTNGHLLAAELPNGHHPSEHQRDGNDLEPIAIIGAACRFPGGASSPSKLWDNLASGSSAWSDGPGSRFNFKSFYHPQNPYAGTTNTKGGHFLTQDIATFDASFFGIHPVEAGAMDPQQRMALEIAYEAFENAGLTPRDLDAANAGVYVGQWTSDYAEVLSRDTGNPATYHATGAGPAITSNRISYQFNLRGPSFTVDTGCSASLVALHMAVQSLRSGETDFSFVGGVNLLVDPQRFIYQSKLKMFSDDGRSFAFDHRANGYGRGEGCSGVVLKPLKAALRDGDHIRGVIRNTVLNQDGKTNGISVPSAPAQERAIRKAYGDAGLELFADYVEAHGTGTKVGDPIEVGAIAAALSKQRHPSDKMPIGSVKGNIGHTESAAGLAGLIKALLMLENGAIPPQVNYEKPNEKILLDEWRLRVPQELEKKELNRISINSFGYGGTNAHVILDSARNYTDSSPVMSKTPATRPRVFLLSAQSEASCKLLAANLADYVFKANERAIDKQWLDRMGYTLNRRAVYRHRLPVIADDAESLHLQLKAASEKPIPPTNVQNRSRVGYVFSGQGAQYYNMGRELIGTWPAFTASLKRANETLSKLGADWDVFTELNKDAKESGLDEPARGQPLSTAIQMALIDGLESLGLRPNAVAGHSSGEIAAAYSAKFLSFEDAVKVSYHRGRLTSQLLASVRDTPGAMLAVGAASGTVEGYIADLTTGTVKIACYNSPSSVTVSGDRAAIEELSAALEADSIFNRILRTNGAAYHSEQMRAMADEYGAALEGLQSLGESDVTMVSSLTGAEISHDEINADYWVQNLVSPVYFEDALWELCQPSDGSSNVDVLVELGPHSQLEGPVKQTLQTFQGKAKDIFYTSVLKRKVNAHEAFLSCVSRLFSEGIQIDLHRANAGFQQALPAPLKDLPSYAFDHQQTFWHESRLSKDFRHRKFLPHYLLGSLSPDVNRVEPKWRRYLSLKELPWLESHIVQGQVVFPAAGYLAMAVEAVRQFKKTDDLNLKFAGYNFRSVSIGKALVVDGDLPDQEICLSLRPEPRTGRDSSATWLEFRVFSIATNRDWSEHCRGLISVVAGTPGDITSSATFNWEDTPLEKLPGVQHITPEKFYYLSRDTGLDWRAPFNNVTGIKLGTDSAVCTIKVPDMNQNNYAEDSDPVYIMHPGTLDAALFHGLCSVLLLSDKLDSAPVPTFIESLFISTEHHDRPGNTLTCRSKKADGPQVFDVVIESGNKAIVRATGVTASKLPGDIPMNPLARELCHSVQLITHSETITEPHLLEICQPAVTRRSIAKETEIVNALALNYISKALKEVSIDQVPEGYRHHWYQWAQSETKLPVDQSKLPANGELGRLGVAAEAVAAIGENMSAILTGKVEPLSLLNSGDLLTRIYSDERCQRCYAQIAAYVRELARQNPGLKALEVGAGTGSATVPLLTELHRDGPGLVSRYDFTDISPVFFDAARKKLEDFESVMNYQVFDVERSAGEQSFEEGSYDLVLACNVVHATKSIGESLDRIRTLLRPGGTFILLEITSSQIFYNLIFGSLPGWWLGTTEGRISTPLIEPSKWAGLLTAHGFSDPSLSLKDYGDNEGGTMNVFISTKAEPPKPLSLPVEIVTDGTRNTCFPELAALLQAQLGSQSVSRAVDLLAPSQPNVISIFTPDIWETLGNEVSSAAFQSFKDRLLSSKAALLLSRGSAGDSRQPDGGMATGFARCFRCENPDVRLVTLDLDLDTDAQGAARALKELLNTTTFDLNKQMSEIENEFAERHGQLFVTRIVHEKVLDRYVRDFNGLSEPEVLPFAGNERSLMAQLRVPGLLETLCWRDIPNLGPLDPNEIEIDLRAASINFKDVLIAAGQLEGLTEMKNDCSGVVVNVGANMQGRFKKGDRVCAYYSRSYTNRPRVHGDCCAVVPDSLSFEAAASLPIVWGTVYFSLVDKAHLSKGESVLIHSAAGAVGQAAILLSQSIGAEIFATVGTDEKKKFLVDTYGLNPKHIFSSRTTAFGAQIRKLTPDNGVDVVLNSLSGDVFRETCNTVAPYGRFVEIGRKEFMDDMLMPSKFLLKNITFAYVDLAALIEDRKPLVRRVLQDVVALQASGAVRPTTIMKMPISEIEAAFRLIQAGKHIGKVILSVEPDQLAKIAPPKPDNVQLKADGSYVIVGGLGGLGKAIIRWLAARGARNIITLSRSGAASEEGLALIEELRKDGVSVISRRCDVSKREDVQQLLSTIEQDKALHPLHGVIQSAMVVKDATFVNMTEENWSAAVRPKIAGSWNLHELLPKDIDFFVLMSSAVALSGNPGQTNYASACAYQDSLARFRRRQGLPAYSINVGAVVEAGFVSENPEVAATLRRQGLGTITTSELLAHLNYALLNSRGALAPTHSQSSIGLVPAGNERGLGAAAWITESRFRSIGQRDGLAKKSGDDGADIFALISSADTPEAVVDQVTTAILQQLSKLIAKPVEHLSDQAKLDDYGVDSLVAVELRNWIGAYLQANVPILVLRNSGSIRELAGLVAKDSRLVSAKK